MDNNKRLGWLSTVAFLHINGKAVELDEGEAFELVLAVAEGRLDVDQIAGRLETGG